jgi:hypothetical protein
MRCSERRYPGARFRRLWSNWYDDTRRMGTDLTSNNDFDDYADRFGWAYDNGANYRGEFWDSSYVRRHFLLLRKGPDQVCVVRFEGRTECEIWSGVIRTSDDFDRMMQSIAEP